MTAGEEKEGYQPDPKEIEAVESLSRQVQRGEERIAFGKKIKAKIEEQKQNKQREEQERIAAISKNITSFEEWSTNLLQKYEALHSTVLDNLPNLWNAFEFALSVKTILNIKGITLPFAGIILGPPSSLKTVVIELLKGRVNTFHTHSFSPKSWVSHSTAVKREELHLIAVT